MIYDGTNLTGVSQAIFDEGSENMIRIFVTNNFAKLQQSSVFISRCRRIFEFKRPNYTNLKIYISKIFDVELEATTPLVEEIINFEIQHQTKLAQDRLEIDVKNEQNRIAATVENKSFQPTPYPNDKDPLGFRELNYFLCEFIGCSDPLTQATNKFGDWATARSSVTSDISIASISSSSEDDDCVIA